MHGAMIRLIDASKDLEEGALATAIAPDDTEELSLLHFERDIIKSPELFIAGFLRECRDESSPHRRHLLVWYPESLAQVFHANRYIFVHTITWVYRITPLFYPISDIFPMVDKDMVILFFISSFGFTWIAALRSE